MWKIATPLTLAAILAACGQPKEQPMNSTGNQADMNAATPASAMQLSSSAFANGQPIPTKYGCDSDGVSPPLSWSGLPDGTRSLVIAIDDPDAKSAPGGVFRHWAAYDIPASMTGLPEGAGKPGATGFRQSLNDGGKPGYTPMCPPRGDPPHHYHFRLIALDVPTLEVAANAKVEDVEKQASAHRLGETELVGTFVRK